MMEASFDPTLAEEAEAVLPTTSRPRRKLRRRYEPYAPEGKPRDWKPTLRQVEILKALFECRLLLLPQIARLLGIAENTARDHMRKMLDSCVVKSLEINRFALADPADSDRSLVYGSAPNLYVLTKEGLQALHTQGLIDRSELRTSLPQYSASNSRFLAHTLAIKDVRILLVLMTRMFPVTLEHWVEEKEARLPLGREKPPVAVFPDAWFRLRVGRADHAPTLTAFVEVDRGTERGAPGKSRWSEKFLQYGLLFDGDTLRVATGQKQARILVIVPDEARRSYLTARMQSECHEVLAQRFWIGIREEVITSDLTAPIWRVPFREMQPLLPQERLLLPGP